MTEKDAVLMMAVVLLFITLRRKTRSRLKYGENSSSDLSFRL